jgi:hypothetical protein
MNNIHLSFDEYLTLKALKFKSDLSGHGNRAFIGALVERDAEQAEAIGMKNMCFRVHPVLQARFEVTIGALGISKQEALTEMIEEMLNQIDNKLERVGVGALSYDARLRELGYEFGPEDSEGCRPIHRLDQPVKE